VDYVIRGEGEVAMPQLVEALSNGTSLEGISGLVYRRRDGELEVKPPVQMPDPDDFPLPAYQLVNRKFYRRNQTGSLVIVAGRGCPMQCSYCCFGKNSYQTFRKRSVSSIIREIEQAQRVEPLGFIDFEDEHLTLDRHWFLELMNTIQSRFGYGAFELRAMNGLYPPSLDEEVIGSMKSAGFKTLNLSLGSASKEQLRRFNRPDVRMAFNRALELAEKYDLNAVGYVISAAPDQQAADSISDLLFLARRRVLAGISIYYPAPGSRDYDSCIERDLLPANLSCLRSSALPLAHATSRLESATILRLSRVLNFMKSLLDRQIPLPRPDDAAIRSLNPNRRLEAGLRLLGRFLGTARISGITAAGAVYDHLISEDLARQFLNGIRSTEIRGTR
jgi:radical SAM superfamily enzyme YgiQ (UPF0313 family)